MTGKARTTKPRETNTCKDCRRRKVKCDQKRPSCTRCLKGGTRCIYDDVVEKPRERSYSAATLPATTPLKIGENDDLSDILGMPELNDKVAISPKRMQEVETRINSLNEMVQAMRENSTEIPLPLIEEESVEQPLLKRARRASDDLEIKAEHSTGHLSIQGGGRTKYVEAHFWACLCDEASTVDELLRGQNRYDAPSTPSYERGDSNPSSPTSSITGEGSPLSSLPLRSRPLFETGGDLFPPPPAWEPKLSTTSKFQRPMVVNMTQLPSRSQCDCLVEAFLISYQSIAPLIHVPSFLNEYETFWTTSLGSHRNVCSNASFISLLYAILHAGSVACANNALHEAFGERTRSDLSSELYRQTTRSLRQASFPRTPTIDSFTAYLISQSTWLRDEEPLTCCSFVGVAVRIAQMLGLNKDPSHFPTIAHITAEVRRRVWWYVFYIDICVSTAAGLPPLIEGGSWDVRPISEVKDHLIGTPEALEYEKALDAGDRLPDLVDDPDDLDQDSLVSTSGVYAGGKYCDVLTSKYLLSKLFEQRHLDRRDVLRMTIELERLRSSMLSRIRRIPECALTPGHHQSINVGDYAGNSVLNKWARLLLSALCDKNWCFFYHPVLYSAISTVWIQVQPCASRHCRDFLQKFIYLSVEPDFRPWQWSWPGKHQPLHTLMILLKDIDKDPYSPDSLASRILVDEALALCAPTGGITSIEDEIIMARPLTEGGQEAWDMIRRLRSRVWERAGADPDVLWTREQVTEHALDKAAHDMALPSEDSGSQARPKSFVELSEILEGVPRESHDAASTFSGPVDNIDWSEWDALFTGQQSGASTTTLFGS